MRVAILLPLKFNDSNSLAQSDVNATGSVHKRDSRELSEARGREGATPLTAKDPKATDIRLILYFLSHCETRRCAPGEYRILHVGEMELEAGKGVLDTWKLRFVFP